MNAHQDDVPPAPFLPANPAAWFITAEGSIRLSNIADVESRFYNVLHALPEPTVVLIADLVEAVLLPANRTRSSAVACWLRTS
jgi:hypothetical protein